MWTLNNDQLPTVATPESFTPLCYLETGESLAPLCQIDFQANYSLPGVLQTAAPTLIRAVTNSINTIELGALVQVDAIAIGDKTYFPAKDPSNPRPGEFTVVGHTATLQPLSSIPGGLPVTVFGGTASTSTDYIDPSILEVFYGLPVKALLNWSMSIENHPSGSIALQAIGDDDCAIVDQRFKRGTILTFAGIGFLVTSYTKTLENTHHSPGRIWSISVSLGGKWESQNYQNPVFLVPSANLPTPDGAPYKDPECQLFGTIEESRAHRPLRLTVSQIAARSNVPFVGFSSSSTRAQILDRVGLKPFPAVKAMVGVIPITPTQPLDVWSIPVPTDAPRGATITWQEPLDSLKRINGCYVDYTSPIAIYARDIESGNRWAYSIPEIAIAFKGDATNSPGIEGYGAEYQAAKLTGLFSEPTGGSNGSTQGISQWKYRSPVIKTLKSNPNADTPPDTFKVIRNMAMNWDVSGPTQESVIVTTQDGVEVHKQRFVYGAAFTSDEVTRVIGDKRGPVSALATSFWQLVLEEATETLFDPDTRYGTGSKTSGIRKGRYKQETDALELLGFEGTDKQSKYEASLFRFKTFLTYAVEQKALEQFGSYYKDVQREPVPMEVQKRCLPDGTSGMVAIRDPNFVEPMFERASLSYTNSFSHTRHPDSTPSNPVPDLVQGEERLSERAVFIQPSHATESLSFGYIDNLKKASTADDLFAELNYEISSQGSGFSDYTAKRTFDSKSGRPGAAQQGPGNYEREEPEQDSGNPNIYKNPQEAEFDYVICTPGHDPNEASTSSIGYPSANYLHQAIVGAETDLKFKDVQQSMEYSATIPTNYQLRPFDYMQLNDGENIYRTRVNSIENSLLIQGSIEGHVLTVTPQGTQIKSGIDRVIPFTITRRPTPKVYQILGASRTFGLKIGDIIPPNLQGRGNY